MAKRNPVSGSHSNKDKPNGPAYSVQTIDLSQMLGRSAGSTLPKTISDEKVWQFYRRWAFAAADACAKGVMMVDLEAQQLQSDGTWENDPSHPMSQLLRFVNPYMTAAEWKYWTVADLEMSGTSYWKIIANGMGEPAELWPIIGKMEPKISKDSETKAVRLSGWVNDMGKGQKEELEPEEVLFLRYPKPGSFWEGYGPAQAAASELRLDDAAVQSMWSKFKQGVFPSALLFMKTEEEDMRENFVQKMETKFGGVAGQGRVIGLADTMRVEWPPTTTIMGDFKGSESIRDTILGVMRTPKSILGIDVDANRASIWGMKQIYADYKLKPTGKMIEERLDQDLAPMFSVSDEAADATVRAKFGDFDPHDPELQMKQEEQDLRTYVRSVDEVRAGRGLDDSGWGAVPLAPISIAPLDLTPVGDRGSESEQSAPVAMADEQCVTLGAFTREQRKRIITATTKARQPIIDAYERHFRAVFSYIEKELLEAWKRDEPENQAWYAELFETRNIDKVLDREKLARRVAKNKAKIDRQGVFLGGEFEQELLDPEGEWTKKWGPTSRAAREAAQEYGFRYVDEIASETSAQIKSVIQRAVENQATWDELRLAIIEKMGEMKTSRANAIATTETTRLWNAGGQAFRTENGVERKQWVASFVRTRETHAVADGQVRLNNENFDVGGDSMTFPGEGSIPEENVNCRCTAVGFIERTRG